MCLCACVCVKILAQVYRCVLDHVLSLCQCKLGSGRFSRAVFRVEPEPWASPEQVGFQKAYEGISQIHGVKTWPNSDWPLSGSTLTFCSDQQRCNKLFRLCGRGLLKQNSLPSQPSAGRGRERAGNGRKKGEESKREGGEKGSEENQGEKGGICLKGYCLLCVRCLGFFFRQCSLCWDLDCFVLSAVWSLSSLMSLNSQGHSNLAQDSAFCRVALTDVWDVFVTLLDVSSVGYRSLGV